MEELEQKQPVMNGEDKDEEGKSVLMGEPERGVRWTSLVVQTMWINGNGGT